MGVYIHLYNSQESFEEVYNGEGYVEPWVSCVIEEDVRYNKTEDEKEDVLPNVEQHLTFDVTSAGVVNWKRSATANTPTTIQYRRNGGEWVNLSSEDEGASFPVNTGDTIRFRSSGFTSGSTFSGTTCGFNLRGNSMSLLGWDSFSALTSFSDTKIFSQLFAGCVGLVEADKLLLPATALTEMCYYNMFYQCSSMTKAPELVALTVPASGYYGMFNYCKSLLKSPAIPSTGLSQGCYSYMFSNCESMVSASSLPVMSVPDGAYSYMFYGCSALTAAPNLPATTVGVEGYRGMFLGSGIINGIDVLPAKTIQDRAYQAMFGWCSNLTVAPTICGTTAGKYSVYQMFTDCTSITSATVLTTNMSAMCAGWAMFSGCLNLGWIKFMATNFGTSGINSDTFKNMASTGTFYRPSSMAGSAYGRADWTGWTFVDA